MCNCLDVIPSTYVKDAGNHCMEALNKGLILLFLRCFREIQHIKGMVYYGMIKGCALKVTGIEIFNQSNVVAPFASFIYALLHVKSLFV